MIQISELAAQEIKRLQSSRQLDSVFFRLSVQKGGCADLVYRLEFDTEHHREDHCFESQGISIVTDTQSYPYLQGLKLDFSEDLMGGGFRFYNPNSVKTCGCGQSFSVDDTASVAPEGDCSEEFNYSI